MAEYTNREHYIPLRKSDLVELLCKDARMGERDREPFRQFCRLVAAVWHFEYLETLDKLKDAYAPFDPDAITAPPALLSPDQRQSRMDRFFNEVVSLMERANFKRLTRKDIDDAVEGGASDWGVNMSVDFDVFERLELFVRSEGKIKRTKKHPFFFWRKDEKMVDTYQRLALLVKMRKHKRLPETIDTDDVFFKMFKDIPKLDLEMILPGTSIQMPLFQKVKMGSSLLGTLGYGFWKVFETLVAGVKVIAAFTFSAVTTAATILFGPLILLGGYAYKQYAGYQITKQTYTKMLTESLYFQTVSNNMGVITHLVDEAEEQECRETILAYYYLWKHAPAEGWDQKQLDDYIEMELEGKLNLKIDFEVEDALAKLVKLNIVTRSGDKLRVASIDKALEALDYRWDNYFQFNRR